MRSIWIPEAEPPDGQLAEPVDRMRGREGHAVVGPDRLREATLLERALEDGEGELLLRRRQGLAGQQVAAGEIGDRQRVAVPAIAEHEFAFVVRAPEGIRLGRPRERGAGRSVAPSPPAVHQAVPVEHRVDRADRRQVRARELLAQLLADLRRAPAGILALQPDDHRLDRQRELIGLAIRPPAAIRERVGRRRSLYRS